MVFESRTRELCCDWRLTVMLARHRGIVDEAGNVFLSGYGVSILMIHTLKLRSRHNWRSCESGERDIRRRVERSTP